MAVLHQQELFKFAFFPKYQQLIDDLADNLAAPEQWDFSDDTRHGRIILKNYLEHTYRRLVAEDKIRYTPDEGYACFNTGLFTSANEEIFALFFKNKYEGENNPPYVFRSFCLRSDNQLQRTFRGALPRPADYFQRPEELVFNPGWELVADIQRIAQEYEQRLPAEMQLLDEEEVCRRLDQAVDEARRSVRANYRIAVPQFFGGRIQLLLPLRLTPGAENPDLALVVHRIEGNAYMARTCLTMRMAYNNARLISRPESSWLKA